MTRSFSMPRASFDLSSRLNGAHPFRRRSGQIAGGAGLILLYFGVLPYLAGIEGGPAHVLARFWLHAVSSPFVWLALFWALYIGPGKRFFRWLPAGGYPKLLTPAVAATLLVIVWSYTLQLWLYGGESPASMHRKDWLFDLPSWCFGLWGSIWGFRKATPHLEAVQRDIVEGRAWSSDRG